MPSNAGIARSINIRSGLNSLARSTASRPSVAAIDSKDAGHDDLAAGAILALGDGFKKYGDKGSNFQGNIVDALIAGLNEYRSEMVRCGKIPPPVNS